MAKVVVLGVIGIDTHSIGIWVLKYGLSEAGFKVVDLGVAVSQEEFINAAIECKADAILVSSLNGHAMFDCDGFRHKCEEAGLKNILMYIGGYLVAGAQDWRETKKKFEDMGFNRVYPPNTLVDTAIADLTNDLAMK